MTRQGKCDCCGQPRARWQRLCTSCWKQLPGDVRFDITDGHRCKNKARHRDGIRRAKAHLAAQTAPARSAPTPTQAYAAQQRLLGERDD